MQAASVIGKDVPYALLAAIAEQPEEALRRGLAHLQEAEFLYETQLFPDLEFTFKHALTHDVAYAGLLGERRRDLHAAVAAAIERLHADRLVEHVERLAHHARQGEVWDKAVRYLRQAGARFSCARPTARRPPTLSRRWTRSGGCQSIPTRSRSPLTSALTSATRFSRSASLGG